MTDYATIKKFGADIMRRYGWEKKADFNSHRRVASKDWCDQIWIHPEKRYMVLIEEKYGEDRQSEGQERLWCDVLAHKFPAGVFYAIVSSEDDWQRVAESCRI